MMIGERNSLHPMVHVPPWSSFSDNPTVDVSPYTYSSLSPNSNSNSSPNHFSSAGAADDCFSAFQRFLPSNRNSNLEEFLVDDFDSEGGDGYGKGLDYPVDAYSCDQFRIFEFKVKKCTRGRSHDWTECPYAHPGEKARRRDPRKYLYSGTACPDFRKGNCRKGDACEFAHGVFECWLHPARYRTQPCKDGLNCKRRVCFFAHSPDQLRVLSPRAADSYDGSPHRLAFEGSCGKTLHFISSPESGSPTSESPPMSPMTASNSINSLSRSLGSNSINEVVASLRQLQLNKVKSMPSSWNLQMNSPGLGSPRMGMASPGYCSLPNTPTRAVPRPGISYFDAWDKSGGCKEEPAMERVESGRDLRAKMFEKLCKENPLDQMEPNLVGNGSSPDVLNPDVGWVSDLIQ